MDIPPYLYRVWFKGDQKPVKMIGFDEDHIRGQCNAKPVKIQKIKEKVEKIESEHLGPPGADVGRPAEYEPAFKILKEWVDSIGGPPEDVRKAIRVHWIDYQKAEKPVKKMLKNGAETK